MLFKLQRKYLLECLLNGNSMVRMPLAEIVLCERSRYGEQG